MEKNRVLGELLYIGLRYEKSRPWKRKFNKEQTEHIVLLREILMAMMEGEVSKNDTLVIENLWKLIHKIFVDKKRVKKLLQALHNLPRVYLTQNLPTLCDRKEARLNPELAMKYAEDNMDDSMKEKYKNFFH